MAKPGQDVDSVLGQISSLALVRGVDSGHIATAILIVEQRHTNELLESLLDLARRARL